MPYFCDEANLIVHGGKGGDGSSSFRRESFVPLGGPDGGNGAPGGNVVFKVNTNINTLIDYATERTYHAEDGGMGHGKNMTGRDGQDLILEVPIGTLIYDKDTRELLADLNTPDAQYMVAKGGRGGKGNASFVSSIRQAPALREYGDRGDHRAVHLELQLVADVGIIGFPSVGKSTLISVISAAKPKIADYEFTTLVPNLGVVKVAEQKSFVVCDIPGLIEGASEGKGLGHEFLRHVKRCRILVHLLDPMRGEIVEHYKIINKELKKFDPELAKKPQVVVLNKIDALSPEELEAAKKELKKAKVKEFHTISAVAHMGTKELIQVLYHTLETQPEREVVLSEHAPIAVLQPHLDDTRYYDVEKIDEKNFRVRGARIEQIARMTPIEEEEVEGLARLTDVLHKIGANRHLKKLGAKPGHRIHIGEKSFEFIDWD